MMRWLRDLRRRLFGSVPMSKKERAEFAAEMEAVKTDPSYVHVPYLEAGGAIFRNCYFKREGGSPINGAYYFGPDT